LSKVPSEESEVFDPKPADESKGEALVEFANEEMPESLVTFLLRTEFWGRAVVDMLTVAGRCMPRREIGVPVC